MICRTKEDQHLKFPGFYLSGQTRSVCTNAKYLGQLINDKMEDDADMLRQRIMLCPSQYVSEKMSLLL